jgi:purine-binding chemotaxis protein CheW
LWTILEFAIEGSRYGVRLERVIEVAPRVHLTPLPGTAPHVAGAFVYRGEIALAVDVRPRLRHPPRRPSLHDHLIVTRGRRRPIAAVVDRVVGLREIEPSAIAEAPVASAGIAGVVVLPDGLLLLDGLETVLSAEDEERAEAALLDAVAT